ncbi:MAG TPA: hypothetical protein VI874_04865, partial [Candidatus Norongarragalinales archaeon]|nr:hypothetical protein [Candidatus Norongarragalinales archaeon]
ALRRTMESFSKNVRFILSANYSSRIIEPIQSRCAIFRFSPLSDADVATLVRRVALAEKLQLDDAAVAALVAVSEGDARKALNILQGVSVLGSVVTEETVLKVSAMARPKEVAQMLDLAWKGRFTDARKALDQLMVHYGLSGEDVLKQAYREVVSFPITDDLKVHLVDRLGEYSFRLSEGADERIQLEAFLAQVMLAGKKKA